jgi:hypothetical protein
MKVAKTPLAIISRELVSKNPKEYSYSIYTRQGSLVDISEDIVRDINKVICDIFRRSPLERISSAKKFKY